MQNNLKLLILIMLVLLITSYFVLQDHSNVDDQGDVSRMLIPSLQTKINDIDAIVISKNEQKISLNKVDGIWRLEQSDDFMADANKVAAFLLELRKFSLKQKKTSNPDHYGKLALAESGSEAAINIVLSSKGDRIADVDMGKQAQRSQGTYVRERAEKQTWLADGELTIKLAPSEWMLNTIVDIDASAIKAVTFVPNDNSQKIVINKLTPNDQQFVLKNIPESMQLKASADLGSLANGLQKLTVESAFKKSSQQELGENVSTVTYELFSGALYQLTLNKKEDAHFLSVSSENLTDSSVFQQQLNQWVFKIPSYKFNALNKNIQELIEEIPGQESSN